jgi:streptogramin lyase
MTKTSRQQQLKKLALITTATIAATISVAGCSTSTPDAGPTTTAVSKPGPTSSSAPAGSCEVDPSSAALPTAEPYRPVPAVDRISVAMSGIPSGTVKPGDPPTEVDVTLCNNSPVDYPKVGVVLALARCSCATSPMGLPQGSADRFDAATGSWIKLEHPVMGTGMDYLGGFTDVQELPKGKAVTLRYRVALDASMVDGKGGVEATAVLPDPLVQIGKADLPFTVSKESTPSNGPRPDVLPFNALTYPSDVAVSAAGDVYITDTGNDRVLKLAVGSKEQTVLPFTNLHAPGGVAVDPAGNVYITDYVTAPSDFGTVPNSRVLKLAAGSSDQSVLPFSGLGSVQGVAVDNAGNVYVADNVKGDTRVVKSAVGSNDQSVLPFTAINSANGIAVDGAGTVYVNDAPNNRVVKLAPGSADQTVLPLAGLEYSDGIAVDTAGDVYVIDTNNRQVLKLAAGSSTSTLLPSTGLYAPEDLAVDGAGNVYVIDSSGFGRVVKLAAG